MNARLLRSPLVLVTIVLIVVVCALLLLSCFITSQLIESWGKWQLTREAIVNNGELSARLVIQTALSDSLSKLATIAEARKLPNLGAIKTLASKEQLTLDDVEQVNGRNETTGLNRAYVISVSGAMGGLVRMIRELEETYVADISSLQLYAVTATGDRVTMRFIIQVQE